jgi:autotransporter passenger strand-loop-strand repeat protein
VAGYFAEQSVNSGATAIGTVVSGPYSMQIVFGTASGTTVQNSGMEWIAGVDFGATVSSGGPQYVDSGGVANAAVILSGATQSVVGTTSAATISSGGVEVVYSGGIADGTTVLSGGEIEIYAGAVVSGLTVSSGGIEVFVSAGASTTAAVATVASVAAPPASAVIESTVANLIQALASFDSRAGDRALFEPVSGGWLHEDAGTVMASHRSVSRN